MPDAPPLRRHRLEVWPAVRAIA